MNCYTNKFVNKIFTMDANAVFPDYYQILECEKTATLDELKKSYQRLVLLLHPDKQNGEESEQFLLVQKAWSVLRDPTSRMLYNAELACHEHSEVLLYEAISLRDMNYDADEGIYSYTCRCGGTYLLEESESFSSKVTIGCDECSFSIEVSL